MKSLNILTLDELFTKEKMAHEKLSKTAKGNGDCRQSFYYQLKELESELNIKPTGGAMVSI